MNHRDLSTSKALMPGDIVLFYMRPGSKISKLICVLTNSEISHSALIYDDTTLLEVITSGGMQQTPFAAFETPADGRFKAVARRASQQTGDHPTSLVKAMSAYKGMKVNYDYASIIMVGGLLVYKKARPSKKTLDIVYLFLQAACVVLKRVINELSRHIAPLYADHYMICSEFVDRVYRDAGEPYAIQYRDPLLANPGKEVLCLADAAEGMPMLFAQIDDESDRDIDLQEMEAVAAELCNQYSEAEQDTGIESVEMLQNAMSPELVGSVQTFVQRLTTLQALLGIDVPLPSMFVTPEDLLHHAENVVDIGEFYIQR